MLQVPRGSGGNRDHVPRRIKRISLQRMQYLSAIENKCGSSAFFLINTAIADRIIILNIKL
jgi:hypothetical protein